jgi:hypothetical protein
MKRIRIQRLRARRDTTGVRPYRPTRETRMSYGRRRWPVPVIASAEEQPGSHIPAACRDGGQQGAKETP